jgi:ABC-type oligopeptide transport system substrate-binding subunit
MFNLFKKKEIDWVQLPAPDDSIPFFETIKYKSEAYWAETTLNTTIYGFQIQENSTWRPGLTDNELREFEIAIGYEFPLPLRNFYKTMNGLTKPGINIFGNDGTKPTFRPVFYSYPNDLQAITDLINWIYKENNVQENVANNDNISAIFPICWHRFMLIDIPGNPI